MIMPDKITDSAYLDLKGLSVYSSLKVPCLRTYIREKNLPCFKVQGKILIKRSEFDRWLEGFRMNKEQEIDEFVDEILESVNG